MYTHFCCHEWGQIVAVIGATLTVMSDGMHYGWSSSALILLQQENSPVGVITMDDEYWLETFLWIGGAAGLPITILATDKLGRKGAILLASSQNMIAWLAIALTSDLRVIHAARFLAGIASNTTFVAIPMYIAECADAKIRGFLGTMIFTMMMSGTVLGYAIIPFLPIWTSCAVGMAINIIHLFFFVWMPESPYYHLLKGNLKRAELSLQFLRSKPDTSEELTSINLAVARQSSERGRPKDLLIVASNRKALLIMTFLNVTQHMCGISVILMNVQPILRYAGSSIEPHFSALLFGCVMLSTLFFGSVLIDRFGRKVLLIVSSVLCSIVLAILGGYLLALTYGFKGLTFIPTAALIGYAIANRLGIGLVPIVMTGEIFPTSVKSMGMTLVDLVYSSMAIVSLKIYFWTSEMWGMHVPFLLFACWGIFAAVVVYFFVPETKGKTLEQIQMKLKKQDKLRETSNPETIYNDYELYNKTQVENKL